MLSDRIAPGVETVRLIILGFAPSTIAATSISLGRSRMKIVRAQTVKGRVRIA